MTLMGNIVLYHNDFLPFLTKNSAIHKVTAKQGDFIFKDVFFTFQVNYSPLGSSMLGVSWPPLICVLYILFQPIQNRYSKLQAELNLCRG